MGTNYYFQPTSTGPCEHCGRSDESATLHIGKSSGGWCFALHVIPAKGINDLDDWVKLFPSGTILDEYDRPVTAEEMVDTITNRRRDGLPMPAGFHRQSHSENGPNGLIRRVIDDYCIRHGAGTWDCVLGEFS